MVHIDAVVSTSYSPEGEYNERVVRGNVYQSVCIFHLAELLNVSLIRVCCLLELQLCPEDGESVHVGTVLPDYAASHPILE